jgi:regulator of protease activity HflC (stomatin/prohibitin superfamily)
MDQNTLSIYIHELRNQCLHMQASFDLFNQAANAGQSQGVLFGGQMILMPTSQIAALLWPSRARSRGRGEALRKALQLPEKHVLNDRRLSEIWERGDEKTDEWVSATKGRQIIFDLVGDPSTVGDGTTTSESIFRGYNPTNQVYTFRGVGFNLQALAKAVADVSGRVNAAYRQLFPEQAKAEDEAHQRALAAQQEAAKQAEAANQAAAAPAEKPKAAAKKAPAKKAPAKKAAAKKAPAKKSAAKKPAAKKAPAKKAAKK